MLVTLQPTREGLPGLVETRVTNLAETRVAKLSRAGWPQFMIHLLLSLALDPGHPLSMQYDAVLAKSQSDCWEEVIQTSLHHFTNDPGLGS